jgi:hypothetical protein
MVTRILALGALVYGCACQGGGKTTAGASDGGVSGSGVAGFGSARRGTTLAMTDGSGEPPPVEGSDTPIDLSASASASAGSGSAAAGSGSGSGSDSDVPDPITDPGKALFEMGAVPAWQTVVDRTRYLERRKQHGVAYGVLGGDVMVPAPPELDATVDAGVPAPAPARGSAAVKLVASPYVWLVDDTEGTGSLAIRAKLPDNARVHPMAGDRIALGGAWALDDDRHWYWHVDTITALPPGPPPKYPWSGPGQGHVIASGDLPSGAHTISLAKDNELAYFMLVGAPPAVDGDGWPVADELGNPVYAILTLPGERASYGAQDLRAPDERWTLRRGQTYVVRLGRIHKHDGKPATIMARSAPVRVK